MSTAYYVASEASICKACGGPCGHLPDDAQVVARTSWGGYDRGCVVKEYGARQSDALRLIDEYGDITTLGEVRAKDGQGKVT